MEILEGKGNLRKRISNGSYMLETLSSVTSRLSGRTFLADSIHARNRHTLGQVSVHQLIIGNMMGNGERRAVEIQTQHLEAFKLGVQRVVVLKNNKAPILM